MESKLKEKSLLTIRDLSPEDIDRLINTAESLKEVSKRDIKKVPTLRGKTIINLFYEPSTRTRTSFEIAAKRMSADAINISATSSSVVKGETLKDTALTLEAMHPDVIVLRHPYPGAAHILDRLVKSSVVNAGDGAHEHPSQALLDLMTVKERLNKIKGLKVAIVGDILHSRVARSNILAFKKMGADVTVVAPPTLIPVGIDVFDVTVSYNMKEAIKKADVIIMLRIQLERQHSSFFPSIREYFDLYGLDMKKLKHASKDVIILHPGPMNRGVEIAPDVADGPYSLILDQVENGVAVRMSIFYHLLGREIEN
ncbi:MAG: aspartate carbamoyltransferase catalytic subunit [Thermodesulfobacteriota bacterium]